MTYQIKQNECECCNKTFLTMDVPLGNLTIDDSLVDADVATVELSTDQAMDVYQQLREYLLYWKWLISNHNNTHSYCSKQRIQLAEKKLSI